MELAAMATDAGSEVAPPLVCPSNLQLRAGSSLSSMRVTVGVEKGLRRLSGGLGSSRRSARLPVRPSLLLSRQPPPFPTNLPSVRSG